MPEKASTSAAGRQAADGIPEPSGVAEPGPCEDCARRVSAVDVFTAVVLAAGAAFLVILAADLFTGGAIARKIGLSDER